MRCLRTSWSFDCCYHASSKMKMSPMAGKAWQPSHEPPRPHFTIRLSKERREVQSTKDQLLKLIPQHAERRALTRCKLQNRMACRIQAHYTTTACDNCSSFAYFVQLHETAFSITFYQLWMSGVLLFLSLLLNILYSPLSHSSHIVLGDQKSFVLPG